MSTEDSNTPTSEDSTEPDRPTQTRISSYRRKIAVHERDRHTCISCRENFDDVSHLDADHVVPRGVGGPNTIRNQATLCRRCHEAKHDERDHAPTVRCMSTGDMLEKDFLWFRHFWNQILPALTELANHRVEPKFGLTGSPGHQAWHIPLGDLRRLDELLKKEDDLDYLPLGAHNYM